MRHTNRVVPGYTLGVTLGNKESNHFSVLAVEVGYSREEDLVQGKNANMMSQLLPVSIASLVWVEVVVLVLQVSKRS